MSNVMAFIKYWVLQVHVTHVYWTVLTCMSPYHVLSCGIFRDSAIGPYTAQHSLTPFNFISVCGSIF
jgi:hypothetical protein